MCVKQVQSERVTQLLDSCNPPTVVGDLVGPFFTHFQLYYLWAIVLFNCLPFPPPPLKWYLPEPELYKFKWYGEAFGWGHNRNIYLYGYQEGLRDWKPCSERILALKSHPNLPQTRQKRPEEKNPVLKDPNGTLNSFLVHSTSLQALLNMVLLIWVLKRVPLFCCIKHCSLRAAFSLSNRTADLWGYSWECENAEQIPHIMTATVVYEAKVTRFSNPTNSFFCQCLTWNCLWSLIKSMKKSCFLLNPQ